MNFSAKHIYLRPVKKDDALAIHLYAGNPEVTRYMLWGPNDYEDTVSYVELSLKEQNRIPRRVYRFAIILKHTDDLIGMIDLTLESDKIGEMGYVLNQSHWGKGYGTEAAKLMVNYGFKTLGLHKIICTCDTRNIGSYRIMEKVGYRRVGTYKRFNANSNEDIMGYFYELHNEKEIR